MMVNNPFHKALFLVVKPLDSPRLQGAFPENKLCVEDVDFYREAPQGKIINKALKG